MTVSYIEYIYYNTERDEIFSVTFGPETSSLQGANFSSVFYTNEGHRFLNDVELIDKVDHQVRVSKVRNW